MVTPTHFLLHFFPNPSGSLIPRVKKKIIIIIEIFRELNKLQCNFCRDSTRILNGVIPENDFDLLTSDLELLFKVTQNVID